MRLSYLAILLAVSFIPGARAGSALVDDKKAVIPTIATPFDQGRLELQSSSGAFFSLNGEDRPTLNYSSTAYRLGIMLNDPVGDGCFRGNFELMLEAFVGSVFDGPGNVLAGGALILRYNFVQPEAKWVPYFQIGAGALYNDIHQDPSQRLIGQAWEIDLEASLGIRYFFNDLWSANLEGSFRHISNAGLNDRNVGLNSLGGGVGLGYHF